MSFCQHIRKKQGVYKLQMVENTLDIRTSDEITCIKIFIAEAYFQLLSIFMKSSIADV